MKLLLSRRTWLVSGTASLLFVAGTALAQSTPAKGAHNLDAQGVAIHGHDPVAYFSMNKPVKGSSALTATFEGATYWFATAENQQAFQADPARYTPQYGGFCAYGVAQGYKPDIDPNAFSVVGGKLYLNLSPGVLSRWVKDIPGYVKSADENWKSLAAQ